ncbi:DUF771 domain-containing protein [Staphylococcus auricularis]|uniref:DUF771 domain-containing protein n=1 Tax=Staphylococcus auricularis TaxID=29379 RepID=UPI001931948C|nr:DUF771 domain-containing protein [Staphylococcus auricularis]MBM0868873.1 DUF771 domain-containing protein [Staphylococcus auricularis]
MAQLTITIPQEYILITQDEYQQLKEKEKPVWWSMQDLIDETGFEYKWLKDNILMNPKYMKELKHFVYYPDGNKWAFNREPMQQFLKENFKDIFGKG